jgi:predicted MPP superfamily phosphohydrolase
MMNEGKIIMRRQLSFVLTTSLLIFCSLPSVLAQTNGTNGRKAAAHASPLNISLPRKDGSVKFAVIGDTGTGGSKQQEVGATLLRSHQMFPFELVLMLGDNLYGGESAKDYRAKFSDVYQQLLDSKVKFYATLGNHDEPAQRFYENFNMEGKEYYRFTKGNVAFYSLNSNYMDKKQVDWLNSELAKDTSKWKILFCHHPPYSSGAKHGSDKELREVVEPLILRHGVNVVLTGHDHFYERIKPQKGVYYFVSGAGGKLRRGDVKSNSPLTDKAFDTDMSFLLIEIVDDQLYFQAISRTGATVDSGVLAHQKKK